VRYLDVDLDDGVVAGEHDRHVLVPIGYARLDRERDRVIVDELASDDLRAIPAYTHGPITRDFETSVRDSWRRGRSDDVAREADDARRSASAAREPESTVTTSGGMRAGAPDDDFYSGDVFDESKFWA